MSPLCDSAGIFRPEDLVTCIDSIIEIFDVLGGNRNTGSRIHPGILLRVAMFADYSKRNPEYLRFWDFVWNDWQEGIL